VSNCAKSPGRFKSYLKRSPGVWSVVVVMAIVVRMSGDWLPEGSRGPGVGPVLASGPGFLAEPIWVNRRAP
jgi:hypothetical protein